MLDGNNHFSLHIQVTFFNFFPAQFLLPKDSVSAFPWKPQPHGSCKEMTGTADKTAPKRRNLKKYMIKVKRHICHELIREQKLFLNFLFQSLKVATRKDH